MGCDSARLAARAARAARGLHQRGFSTKGEGGYTNSSTSGRCKDAEDEMQPPGLAWGCGNCDRCCVPLCPQSKMSFFGRVQGKNSTDRVGGEWGKRQQNVPEPSTLRIKCTKFTHTKPHFACLDGDLPLMSRNVILDVPG